VTELARLIFTGVQTGIGHHWRHVEIFAATPSGQQAQGAGRADAFGREEQVIGTVQTAGPFQDGVAPPWSARGGALDRAHAALQVPSHRRRKGPTGCGVQAILLRRALLGESFQTPRHRTQREAVCRGATQA